jgi:hypothetical protein
MAEQLLFCDVPALERANGQTVNMFRDRIGNTQSDQISVKDLSRTLADWAVMNTESGLAAERGQLWLPHRASA